MPEVYSDSQILAVEQGVAETQKIIPMLTYEDGDAAMDFLIKAFGFTEEKRWRNQAGKVDHGELKMGGQSIFLAEGPEGYLSPKSVQEKLGIQDEMREYRYVVNGTLVMVDDINVLRDSAIAAGARIMSEDDESPIGKLVRIEDPEGQRWMFLQPN